MTGRVCCRGLSFLGTQYFDDVKPHRTLPKQPALALVAVLRERFARVYVCRQYVQGV